MVFESCTYTVFVKPFRPTGPPRTHNAEVHYYLSVKIKRAKIDWTHDSINVVRHTHRDKTDENFVMR